MTVKRDFSKEILEYLRRHPDASDTLEGIMEWWLLNQKIICEMKRVKAAILKLVEDEWIIEIRRKNSAVRYGLNPDKRKELRSY